MSSHEGSTTAPAAELRTLVASEVARQIAEARAETDHALAALRERTVDDRAAIVLFSGDLDKAIAAFVIATGAAAAGLETTVFFTFWGLSVLKRRDAARGRKGLKERLFALMTPGSSESLHTSKLSFFGLGGSMLRSMMHDRGIASLEELMGLARELGVRFMACTMSMEAMGLTREELLDGLVYGGVGAYGLLHREAGIHRLDVPRGQGRGAGTLRHGFLQGKISVDGTLKLDFVDQNDFRNEIANDRQRKLSDILNRDAFGKCRPADRPVIVVQRVPDRRIERGFRAHDIYAAVFGTRCNGVAGNKPAAADRKDQDIQIGDILQHLEGDRPLPGNDSRVVIRVDKQKPPLRLDLLAP